MKKGIIPVFKRELHRMTSRPIYLMMTLIIPSIVIIFFATFLNQGMPKQLPIAVVDFDNSSTSRLIVRTLSSGQVCNVKYKLTSYESAKTKMQIGEIYAFVIIPRDFEKDVYNKKSPVINFHTEYAHYLAGSLIMREINTSLSTLAAGADLKVRLAKGENEDNAMAQVQPIRTDTHIIGNSQLNYAFYLSSIIMPGIIFLMALICTVYVIGIEFKIGSSRRWLVYSGSSIWKGLLGKLIPYTLLFSMMIIVSEIVMERIMGFPSKGNPMLLYLGAVLTVIAYQAMGIFLIGILPSLRTALSIAAFYGVIGFTLSGFTYPHFAMLSAVKPYTYLYPLRQYYMIYSNVQINGLSFGETIFPFIYLLLFNVAPFLVLWNIKSTAIKLNYERD
ncbi:MAG: ABC transporter permease [Bacteroidales bacterium]|jgi:ABC-2 type transport system permease protein|nr:ABC transporter permease [Bacteroidales bacterium]